MDRATLYYDASCGFCRRWIDRWSARTGSRVKYSPSRTLALWRHGIGRRRARRAVILRESNGRVTDGAEAVARTLSRAPGLRAVGLLLRAPGVLSIARGVYRFIANHRTAAARVDRWLTGNAARPASHTRIRRIFFVAMGASFYAMFTSLRRQVIGLYGEHGILPIDARVARVRALGPRGLRLVPTIFLGDASDDALIAATRHGQRLSIALALGIEPRITSAMLWAYYLSFVTVGGEFLGYQWDALALEAAAHCALVAPPARRSRRDEEPTALQVALMRWLVFRLHFESGLVKYRSPDACWRDRTALCHYYETAPLPTVAGWYVHHLPERVQRFATSAALWIELGSPFLALGPRRARVTGFALLTGLQTLIAITGNYGFFNLMTVALNLWLLDDGVFPARRKRAIEAPPLRTALTVDAAAIAMAIGAASTFAMALDRGVSAREWQYRVLRALAPWHTFNTYGPFSVMTTTRPEITIEGSYDGATWERYSFVYKIDDVNRAPRWVAPHQPRVDWQMWFAALDGVPPWLVQFVSRLAEGSRDVLALLASNPFPDRPPRFLRLTRADYTAASLAEHRATGVWWHVGPSRHLVTFEAQTA